jgi:outer membrane protein insertion porin family
MSEAIFEQPAHVSAVRVDGATRTRASFLARIVGAQLARERPETVYSALQTARDIGHYLVQSDVFSHVGARLEPGAREGDVEVVFSTREKGRYFLKTATEVGHNEGTAVRPPFSTCSRTVSQSRAQSATGHIRNVFGGGERLEASVSTGTKTRRAFNGTFSAPLTPTLDTRAELSVYASDKDNTAFASCTELLRGARAVVRVRAASAHDVHPC